MWEQNAHCCSLSVVLRFYARFQVSLSADWFRFQMKKLSSRTQKPDQTCDTLTTMAKSKQLSGIVT